MTGLQAQGGSAIAFAKMFVGRFRVTEVLQLVIVLLSGDPGRPDGQLLERVGKRAGCGQGELGRLALGQDVRIAQKQAADQREVFLLDQAVVVGPVSQCVRQFFAVQEDGAQDVGCPPGSKDAQRFQHGGLAGVVLAGDEVDLAEPGYVQFSESPESTDRQAVDECCHGREGTGGPGGVSGACGSFRSCAAGSVPCRDDDAADTGRQPPGASRQS